MSQLSNRRALGYQRRTLPLRPSRIIVGRSRVPSGPTSISSSSVPNSRRTDSGRRNGIRPLRFALVEIKGLCKRLHNFRTSGWSVTRTASDGRPPPSHGGTPCCASSTQETGPGQVLSISSRKSFDGSTTSELSWSKVAAIRISPLRQERLLTCSSRSTA